MSNRASPEGIWTGFLVYGFWFFEKPKTRNQKPETLHPRSSVPPDASFKNQSFASSTSRTFLASAPAVKGFCRKFTPGSSTPCRTIASSV